jgi:pyridoxal phosphate enzyme (YggS family)
VAVTKRFPAELIHEAWQAGLRDFGENRIQEATEKIPRAIELGVEATWHLVGHLQRNKARQAVDLFDWIQSIDSERLAEEVSKRVTSLSRTVPVLIEVNTSAEPTKYGVTPERFHELAAKVSELPGLELRGLMTVGPLTEDEAEMRAAFRLLRRLAEEERARLGDPDSLPVLSMGMTDDFEIAIEEGSTLVRVGRAIFGERPTV